MLSNREHTPQDPPAPPYAIIIQIGVAITPAGGKEDEEEEGERESRGAEREAATPRPFVASVRYLLLLRSLKAKTQV